MIVNQSDLPVNFEIKKFEKVYKYKVKFVPEDQFKYLISTKNDQYLALFISNMPNAIISVFDLKNDELLYIDNHLGKFFGNKNLFQVNPKQIKKIKKNKIIKSKHKKFIWWGAIILIFATV